MQPLRPLIKGAMSISSPYWRSEERWRARMLLAGIIVLNLVIVATALMFTVWQGAFFNALERRDWDSFIGLLLLGAVSPTGEFAPGFVLNAVILVPASVYAIYLQQALQIRWRNWQTRRTLDCWLGARAYYRIELTNPGADNPDQRISEDIRLFVDTVLTLSIGLMRAVITLVSYVIVLWELSKSVALFGGTAPGALVWIAVGYALVGTLLSHVIGARMIPLKYQQQKAEADFRFGLMRFRENVEGIALHNGEATENRELGARFNSIAENWRGIMHVTRDLSFFTLSFGQVALVLPLAVVSPAYFAGQMTLGGIFQTSNAFVQVQASLSWIVDNYPRLSELAATTQRLSLFDRAVAQTQAAKEGPTVVPSMSGDLHLSSLDISLPDGRSLIRAANLSVRPTERLMLTGPSGTGKSTLLRALSGIWPFGSGAISRPSGRMLFLPQRPYMPLGHLKQVVCYPDLANQFTDEEVSAILSDVGLGHLSQHLAETDSWERRLSGGEQQRLAFARALLLKPDWLFLDEATAALDSAAEDTLYGLLRERLPYAALISIGHRAAISKYHDKFLAIRHDTLIVLPSNSQIIAP